VHVYMYFIMLDSDVIGRFFKTFNFADYTRIQPM